MTVERYDRHLQISSSVSVTLHSNQYVAINSLGPSDANMRHEIESAF